MHLPKWHATVREQETQGWAKCASAGDLAQLKHLCPLWINFLAPFYLSLIPFGFIWLLLVALIGRDRRWSNHCWAFTSPCPCWILASFDCQEMALKYPPLCLGKCSCLYFCPVRCHGMLVSTNTERKKCERGGKAPLRIRRFSHCRPTLCNSLKKAWERCKDKFKLMSHIDYTHWLHWLHRCKSWLQHSVHWFSSCEIQLSMHMNHNTVSGGHRHGRRNRKRENVKS